MPTAVLYVRIDERLKAQLIRLANDAGVPLSQIADIVISRGMGKEAPSTYTRVTELINERFGLTDGKNP